MRKIVFDEETVQKIRSYVSEGHTLKETCNRFTLKEDTLKRVMRENNIEAFYKKNTPKKDIPAATVFLICKLFEFTDTSLQDICKEAHIEYWQMQEILNTYYTQQFQDKRKSRMYARSKQGIKNSMSGKFKELHHNYKGTVGDGNGYLQCLKPDWYTGRKGSKHVFVHTVVMCEHLGLTELPKGWTIHHIDGNKQNNDINNLALITNSGHTKLHSIQRNLCKVQRLSDNGLGVNIKTTETPDKL